MKPWLRASRKSSACSPLSLRSSQLKAHSSWAAGEARAVLYFDRYAEVFEWNGYKFFFFSNEGNPQEPCHIHVRKERRLAKFFVEPVIGLASSWGMTSSELNRLERVVEEHAQMIRRKWNEHFGA
ncbi:MAG: DUF4160 domain-containing protein [Elusimicrobia bacterium]|nr:DUF4160 domain-containing protein [Elusimicrobiota bacterium]